MEIKFFKNNSPTNKVQKTLSPLFQVQDVRFKEPFDEEAPVVTIAMSNFKGADYAFIDGSYYFITGFNHINNVLTEVSLQMDYLETFKSAILGATAYIDRSSSGYNKLLKDSGVAIQANTLIESLPFEPSTVAKFSDKESDGAYVLIVNQVV